MKHITRIIVLLLLVVLLFTCSCVFNPWYVSCNGQVFKHRGVWVVQSEIHEFAEKYIFSPYFTIELPEDYPSLKNIYYAMADWSKQIYTPDEMYLDHITAILEFDFSGEPVYIFIDFRNKNPYPDGINNRTDTAVFYSVPAGSMAMPLKIDYPFQNVTFFGSCIMLPGYERADFMKELWKNDFRKLLDPLYNGRDGEGFNGFGGIIGVYDLRDIPADAKQAWQEQVLTDIVENTWYHYWEEPQSE